MSNGWIRSTASISSFDRHLHLVAMHWRPFGLRSGVGHVFLAVCAVVLALPICSAFMLHPSSALSNFRTFSLLQTAPPRPHLGLAVQKPRNIRRLGSSLGVQCQIKFVDAVSEILKRRFGEHKVDRVIDSWYKMDQDYVHRERVEKYDTWQEANSYIAGLPVKTFYDPYEYAWAQGLRDKAKIIQEEFQRVAVVGAAELELKGNNVWATAANATSGASYGPDWKTLALMDRCVWDETNTLLFPETTKLLKQLQVPCLEAFFARMTPRSKINPHSDFCNFALTSHLGLDVPEGQCWIEVGNERREWRNGEMLMFDTSLYHHAANDADRMRYILMLRVFHPELSSSEVSALRYIFDCLDEPAIVERDLMAHAPDVVAAAKRPAAGAATGGAVGSARGDLSFGAQEGGPAAAAASRAARRAAEKKKKERGGAAANGGQGFGKRR